MYFLFVGIATVNFILLILILLIQDVILVPMTGREAVEHFAKCHHLGKIESMHFNVAPNRYYSPYTLVEVPADKVDLSYIRTTLLIVMHPLC
jgi:hypothetical protein